MAIPIAAIAAAGASLLGAGLNAGATSSMNRSTRQFTQEQNEVGYQRFLENRGYDYNMWQQQNDLLEKRWNQQNAWDLSMWDKQNAYNSPAAQMARYKAAGLNPNLIYGQSNAGGSISTAQLDTGKPEHNAPPMPNDWHGTTPDLSGIANSIPAFLNAKLAVAQSNNLAAQNAVLKQEELLKAATTANVAANTGYTGIKTKQADFDLGLSSQLRQVSVDAAAENLRKVSNEADYTLGKNEREAVSNSQSIKESVERILTMRGQRVNNELDAKLKELDLSLKELGLQPSDNMVYRIIGRVAGPMIKYMIDGGNPVDIPSDISKQYGTHIHEKNGTYYLNNYKK